MNLPVLQPSAEPTATTTPWIGPHGHRMERLELHLTYSCPERCCFCSEEHRMPKYRPFPVTFARVATVLREHASRGVIAVHFTGGEPSIHPEFVRILQLAKKLGMRTSIGTIGTMLSRREFAEQALPYLDEALFSLHGPRAEIHDQVAGRVGSFARVVEAVRLARALKPNLGTFINSVIVSHNIEALPETAQLAQELGASLMVISNLTPEGAGYDNYAELAVKLETLRAVLPRVRPAAPRLTVRFFGVPMCLLADGATCSNDLHWDPRVTVEWTSAPGKVAFDGIYSWTLDRKRVHTTACQSCELKGVCMGVFDRYAELFSTEALRPQRKEPA